MKIGSNNQEIEEKMDVDGDEPLKSGLFSNIFLVLYAYQNNCPNLQYRH